MTEQEYIQRGDEVSIYHAYQLLNTVMPEYQPNLDKEEFCKLRSRLHEMWEACHNGVEIE